ncbi:nuclear receptor 2C2-associated protein-like [Macrosteles quadrilineatus]|uniref:nuclear receptor 2C2-associated protein-like n=1 Tax=Macrosteles quadrilineatus TaxID=74068 RepID=UPI0023E0BD71|nr:nuclear receptor 2C2-associated protein-like [Macrosteles quadrilineatus]
MKTLISDSRVSSVLNKDAKMYGKKYLFDGNEETCWSSDQGSPQWIAVMFKDEFLLNKLVIQFQGGFCGKDCQIEIQKSDGEECVVKFYPEDVNTIQEFPLEPVTAKRVRIVFTSSTDFFGRIVIYSLLFL